MFKTNDPLKLDLSDKSKYVPGIEFPLIEKYLLDKDSRRLRWMRHMWAFFNAQVIKEIYLYMHLKINRTSRLVSSYYKGMETIIDEFGSGYQKLSPVLDLPHAVKIKNRFADGEDYAAATSTVDLFLKTEMPLLNAGKGLVSSQEKTNAIRLPVVALVNGETGAAAEAVAAMLRQTGAGLLIGGRTAGRAGVTSDFKLSSGQTVRVVTAPVLLGDAKPVPATGVVPDIEVAVKADDEAAFYADSIKPVATAKNSSTNATASARSAKRIRVTEADLVREKRGDGDFETVTNARVKSEAEVPVIQDPALARAVDLLKGLAVVRQGKF